MLVERDRELARIGQALNDARNGRGATLVFIGEAGVGKSALLARACEDDDMPVLGMRGAETEAELPFAGLRDLLRPIMSRADGLPAPQRHALLGALAIEEVERVEPFGVYCGVLTLLSSHSGPLLVCVDDFQWLDTASAEAVRFLAKRVHGESILLLVTSRARPSGLDGERVDFHELASLSRQGVEELLAGRVADELVDQLYRATAGNPLALKELTESDAGIPVGWLHGLEPLPVGDAIRRAFARRLDALAAPARSALLVAAVSERDDMSVLVEAAASLDLELDAFLEAESARVVTLTEGRLRFQHPLLRSVVYAQAEPGERRAAHQALATASGSRGRRDEEAWHRAAAAVVPDEDIAAHLDAAAASYSRRSGHVSAARALELAAKLTPSPTRQAERLYRAGESARLAGHAEWAIALLDAAAELAESPALAAEIEFTRFLVAAWRESTVSAREGYEALAARLRDGDPDGAATASAYAAAQAVVEGDVAGCRENAARGAAILAEHQLSGYATSVVLQAKAVGLVLGGDPDGRVALREAADWLFDTNELTGREYVALPLIWIEDYVVATRLIRSRLTAARQSGDLRALTAALDVDATLRYRTGDWRGAHAAAAESVRLCRESQQPVQLAYSLATLAIVQAAQGLPEARTAAEQSQVLGERHGLAELEQYVASALGLAELGDGRPEYAIAHLERAAEYARQAGQVEPAVHQWAADLIDAAVLLGRSGTAEQAVADLATAAATTSRRWAHAVESRARGMLAAPGDYPEHYDHAARLHADTIAPFERARTHLWWGRSLRRDRQRAEARPHLATALAIFDELGAKPWVAMARRELRASGATLRSREEAAGDELTPQELQIAAHVAGGASNKEVAGSMFLSPKTIETHLSRIYRKLGIRSRNELSRVMAESARSRDLVQRGESCSDVALRT